MKNREQRVINILLTLCLALGFLAFVSIYVPESLRRAHLADGHKAPAALPNVGDIATITLPVSDEAKQAFDLEAQELLKQSGIIATFTPEPDPLAPFSPAPGEAATATGSWSRSLTTWNGTEPVQADGPQRTRPSWLVAPRSLESALHFWIDIYSRYDSNQAVLHDSQYLNIIYGIIDFSSINSDQQLSDSDRATQRESLLEAGREEVKALLAKLAVASAAALTEDELRLFEAFQRIAEERKFERAAERIRAQTGLKDKFMAGLKTSGRYLGEIESIFASKGLPRELTRLIFVESMFQLNAESSAGARGIWQFMRPSAKHYGLMMNDAIDERLDPLAATQAAARHLQDNFDLLQSWPLAVNAYNAGRGRLKQAVLELGTSDIGVIVERFRHPSYGFASRNFFAEFLAAVEVVDNRQFHFPGIVIDDPLRFDEILIHESISLPRLTRAIDVDPLRLAELNPSLEKPLLSGTSPLPAGFKLRVPEQMGGRALAALHEAVSQDELTSAR